MYDQLIWGYSHFQILYNTVALSPDLLGDHFHPILALLGPIFWAWNDARMLLITQAILLAAASIPIFLWARQRLGLAAAALFQASYLVFWGILSGDLFDFHQLAVTVPAISLALYAALTRRNLLLWLAVAVAILSKEDVSLTLAFLGFFIVVVQRRWRLGLLLATLSLAYFWFVIQLVIPFIRGGSSYAHWSYEALGDTPQAAIEDLVLQPWDAVVAAINPIKKVLLVGALLGAWLLLPLVSPILIVAIPQILERVWSDNPTFWSTQYQYSMVIGPILAFAAIDAVARINQRLPRLRATFPAIAAGAVLLVNAILSFAVIRPLDELTQELSATDAGLVTACLENIPANASVAATGYLVPHMTHRTQIYLLPSGMGRTTYVALGPHPAVDFEPYLTQAEAAGYQVRCRNPATIVLSR